VAEEGEVRWRRDSFDKRAGSFAREKPGFDQHGRRHSLRVLAQVGRSEHGTPTVPEQVNLVAGLGVVVDKGVQLGEVVFDAQLEGRVLHALREPRAALVVEHESVVVRQRAQRQQGSVVVSRTSVQNDDHGSIGRAESLDVQTQA
jgi:hypothetical protein